MQKKSWVFIVLFFISAIAFYYFSLREGTSASQTSVTQNVPKQMTSEEAKETLEKIYEGISGFGIPEQEVKFIKKSGGAPTYGEIKFESAQQLLDYFNPTENDVFYDLGSGVGKFVLHAYLAKNIKKSCGIELSGTRYEFAVKALGSAKKLGVFDPKREVSFLNDDIVNAPFDDATIIFMCATCYSDELMEKIAEKLIKVGPGLRIATLREFKERPTLKKIETLKLPMTWSESSPVYIYEVVSVK